MNFLRFRAVWLATALLLGQAFVYYGASRAEVIPAIQPWANFPNRIGSWHGEDVAVDQPSLDRLHPDDYLNRVYSNDGSGESNAIFIAYFKTQRDGRAPHSPQNCLPGSGWQSLSNVRRWFRAPGSPGVVAVNEYLVEKDDENIVVHYWFQQNHRVFTSEIKAQFYAMPELLAHGRTDIALVRIITPVTGPLGTAEREGLDFSATVFPTIRDWLR
ncbi:MAG: EpsI family protein [Acidobacteriaceae bacterium]|nr:EpsI family protein [Acidobacteriaceae bacterium]